MPDHPSPDFPEYTPRTAEVWNRLAEWWDDRIGDGNDTQDLLIEPTTERLLALQPGEHVLDVACGAGRFARRMADAGAIVVAVDHSERFVRRARERSTAYEGRIAYHVADASDPVSLLSLA
ncbi:MAG: methyltransferase domain-containing protein [Candidatus Brocadiia bacterium]|jgi:2-polyprenyl-3-methyl-5-hydroxy-6-metoxy-1,4-benzoquinol methylase|nr:methyltransferase domain-containing protein [Candidatus Brocadiia bacterium]